MAIVIGRPPNFEQVLKAFPHADKPGVIFAYGVDVYNPSGGAIPGALLAHESIHQMRQGDVGVSEWWDRYIEDVEFRYNEELLAHVAEYRAQLPGLDRNRRAQLLMATAARLVAPLYNYQPPRSLLEAQRDIQARV